MKHSKVCPKCGSNRVAGPHSAYSYGDVKVRLSTVRSATLKAFICAGCGYTELYSDRKGLENVEALGRFEPSTDRTVDD
jgi:predicted nucleic-acid-binding Zn-ribbon protein